MMDLCLYSGQIGKIEMRVDTPKQYLTDAIWYLELAYNEEDDIPHLRSLLDEAVYLIQEVLNHLDDRALYAEMVANERFGHPRHLKAE